MAERSKDFSKILMQQTREAYGVSVESKPTEYETKISGPMNAWIRAEKDAHPGLTNRTGGSR
jgi:hypothetical protein